MLYSTHSMLQLNMEKYRIWKKTEYLLYRVVSKIFQYPDIQLYSFPTY